MAITSTGIGSGLDINSIVSKLVTAEQTPATTRFNRQEAVLQAKISALGTVKSAFGDFRTSLSALKSASSFSALQATSSDSSVLSVTAASIADVGAYSIRVDKLAQAHSLASKPFASVGDSVGSGTLTIKFGTTAYAGTPPVPNGFTQNPDKGTLTLTVDSSNNTLTGLRDAINKANAGVSASIVNDGSGFRLVLASKDSGAKNSMEVSGLADFTYTAGSATMTETVTAQDALANINGLRVSSASNTVSGALKGITLNLLKVSTSTVNVNVAQNTADISQAIKGVVDKFNAAVDSIKQVSGYDAKTKQAGALLGEASIRGALGQLRALIGQPVNGLSGSIRSLADIGIKTQTDGKLALDSTKLNAALTANKDDVAALFAPIGKPSDNAVAYLSSTSATQVGNYDLNVSAAATRGILTGSARVAPFTVDASNNTLRINVDGVSSGVVTLTESATYTADQLAAELQSRINGDSALKAAGVSVGVSYSAGAFVLQSQSYGSSSKVNISQIGAAGSGLNIGGLSVGSGVAGVDASATLGGTAVTASGRQLTGTGSAEGLKLLLSDDGIGLRGTVRFTQGLAGQFDKSLSGILDDNGIFDSRIQGLQKSVDQIGKDRVKLDGRMQALQARLLKQFNAMDARVAQFQALGTAIGQQLATLPYAVKQNK